MDYFLQNKKLSMRIVVGLVLVVVLSLVWTNLIRTPAYSVSVDGEKTFVVKQKSDVEKTLVSIQKQQEKQNQPKLELSSQVEYHRTFASRDDILSGKELEQTIRKTFDFKAQAAAIMVDGKAIACVESKAQAEELLAQLKKENTVVDEGEKLLSVGFAEKVTIEEKSVAANQILPQDKAYQLITIGTDQPQTYVVKEGDNLWLIARRNDMYVDDIMRANHLKSENLQPGDELILVKSQPYISVVAQVEGEKVETIPFQTKTEIDNSASGVRIKKDGCDGEKKIVYVATKVNGVVDEQEIKEETILKEAVDRILVKGKTVTVASRGSGGALDWPVYGQITKYYQRGHTGLDIGARSGTAIRAADSGTVTFTGWQGGYGNFIIVNHGNGMITRYAHCSSINVSKGQQVARGETIGTVGSTGRSSGPHLHFEILSGGSFQNPLSYLR
jgi:murein DD-endopeptidase MepM/ murein hydrolase activator NlpD